MYIFPVLIFSAVRFSNQHVLHWNASCIGSGVQHWRTHNRGPGCRIRFSCSHTPLPSGGVFSLDIRGHSAEKSWLLSVTVVTSCRLIGQSTGQLISLRTESISGVCICCSCGGRSFEYFPVVFQSNWMNMNFGYCQGLAAFFLFQLDIVEFPWTR